MSYIILHEYFYRFIYVIKNYNIEFDKYISKGLIDNCHVIMKYSRVDSEDFYDKFDMNELIINTDNDDDYITELQDYSYILMVLYYDISYLERYFAKSMRNIISNFKNIIKLYDKTYINYDGIELKIDYFIELYHKKIRDENRNLYIYLYKQ